MHYRGHIPAAIKIIRRRPDRHQVLILKPSLKKKPVFVAFVHQLVRSANQVQIIYVVKLIDDFVAKNEPRAARVLLPGPYIARVAPHQVAKGPVVGDLHIPVDQPDLLDRLHRRREAPVDAENPVFDQGAQREVVYHIMYQRGR